IIMSKIEEEILIIMEIIMGLMVQTQILYLGTLIMEVMLTTKVNLEFKMGIIKIKVGHKFNRITLIKLAITQL
ncbi:MAG TPA: hypothetical protein VEQ18_03075, partial [Candidatus Nitrosocosmicus sp.]|nr:hypothetical protein [Candidatus Nitrosocosmicus sp.]